MLIPLLLATAEVADAPQSSGEIVITASRVPVSRDSTAASVATIDTLSIERQGAPLVPEMIRLTPSAAISSNGPAGTLAQVRIRGAEANQTLLFVDGIKANDLSFGDEPRFELLNSDLASRIEIVRGPQSALWGSQAIGGVVSVDGTDASGSALSASAEAGSFGFRRASGSASVAGSLAKASASLGWQRASGIDMFGGGDRDGYRNLSGRAGGQWQAAEGVVLGANGFALSGRSQFDGDDPFTFVKSQDLALRTALAAGRLWARFGQTKRGLGGSLSASVFRAKNRNYFEGDEIGHATGTRHDLSGQLTYAFQAGRMENLLVAAGELEDEEYTARDIVNFGAADQDSRRKHRALTGEWRGTIGPVTGDIALRHDAFSGFKDATTLRASLLGRIGGGFSIAGSYAEGIAPPTFSELFGFFPGQFVGNPDLKPERSRGFEGSVRYASPILSAALTAYRQRLRDEITTIFFPDFTSTAINKDDTSPRWGIEAELGWQPFPGMRVSANYAFLNAQEPGSGGPGLVREIRRPRHSGSIAVDGEQSRLTYGAALSYVGSRADSDFSVFPALPVTLSAYWLASGRVAYRLRKEIEIFVRGSNLMDDQHQDVFGYRTEGRAIFIGLRLADRRSSP
jgi:vitamin B12 transporter